MDTNSALSDADFKKLREFIYDKLGLDQDEKKKETLTTKVVKLMNRHGMKTPKDYVNYIPSTESQKRNMMNCLRPHLCHIILKRLRMLYHRSMNVAKRAQ